MTGSRVWNGSWRALDAAGWDGLYDIEIFSDNGTFGAAYADSLWDLPPEELLPRARALLLDRHRRIPDGP